MRPAHLAPRAMPIISICSNCIYHHTQGNRPPGISPRGLWAQGDANQPTIHAFGLERKLKYLEENPKTRGTYSLHAHKAWSLRQESNSQYIRLGLSSIDSIGCSTRDKWSHWFSFWVSRDTQQDALLTLGLQFEYGLYRVSRQYVLLYCTLFVSRGRYRGEIKLIPMCIPLSSLNSDWRTKAC